MTPFKVVKPQSRFDDFGTSVNGRTHFRRFFATKRPPAAMSQERLPMLAVFVASDPSVDRARRHLRLTVGILELQPAGDLFRRPVCRQAMTDRFVDLGLVHFAADRSFAPMAFGLRLGLGRPILVSEAVTSQLATDRSGTAIQSVGDILLIRSSISHLCYEITLFQSKMTCHRWISVPKRMIRTHITQLVTSQRCFSLYHFQALDCI